MDPKMLFMPLEIVLWRKKCGVGSSLWKSDTGISDNEEGNWVCLNMDGAMKLDSGLATAGGALRDRHEGWIIGCNRNLARCSVLNPELWGILDGLKIAKDQNYDGVSIKAENQKAI
ncbi:hypothetical protein Gogos_017084 [Gossypium gossypioides]|uniref:RNase H type-1 domain-containing protein n=1 Tax=Gossypium gossypioides TaxID=34282 RepID=A0A7J9BA42_GOSGO|nr:hypothetical protein [Gossypium gossypioides]